MAERCPSGKMAFASKSAARSFMRVRMEKIPKARGVRHIAFTTYRCGECGGWHNTSLPKRKDGYKRFQP